MSKKVYLITDKDFDELTLRVDRNPKHGANGGSSAVLSDLERKAHDEAHSFYNYQVRVWISEMTRP